MILQTPRRSALLPVFLLICLGIVYGSLFPFQFVAEVDSVSLRHFWASWQRMTGFGDILGNLALFFPYGYVARLITRQAVRPGVTAVVLLAGGLLLALACQFGQLFTPGRDPSIFDLAVNSSGVVLGWLGARMFPLGTTGTVLGGNAWQQLSLVVAGAWLAGQLVPFVPTLDMQAWKEALKPLRLYAFVRWQEVLLYLVCWLTFLHLLERKLELRLRVPVLVGGACAIFALQVVIIQNYPTVQGTLALLGAVALWMWHKERLTDAGLACALLVTYAMAVLAPFTIRELPREFGWMPFEGYLRGSMLVNAIALCRKVFVFGAICLLFLEVRPQWLRHSLLLALLLAVLEFLQRWIGYGTPTLTDPLLFLTLAWLIHRQLAADRP